MLVKYSFFLGLNRSGFTLNCPFLTGRVALYANFYQSKTNKEKKVTRICAQNFSVGVTAAKPARVSNSSAQLGDVSHHWFQPQHPTSKCIIITVERERERERRKNTTGFPRRSLVHFPSMRTRAIHEQQQPSALLPLIGLIVLGYRMGKDCCCCVCFLRLKEGPRGLRTIISKHIQATKQFWPKDSFPTG